MKIYKDDYGNLWFDEARTIPKKVLEQALSDKAGAADFIIIDDPLNPKDKGGE